MPITPRAWSDCGGGIGDSSANDVQADTAGDQHHAALHGPQNAAERRAYAAGSGVQGDGRRFEELGSGGRLDVGEQILVGGEAIEEFGVGVGLDFGQPAPPFVVDQRADEPDQQADGQAEAGENAQTIQHVPPDVQDLGAGVLMRARQGALADVRTMDCARFRGGRSES